MSGERSRKRSLMSQSRERGNVGRRDYATFPSLPSSPLSQPFFRIHSRVDWFQRDTYACKKIYSNFIFFTLVSENVKYENYDCRCG